MKVIEKRKLERQLDYNMLKQQGIKDRHAVKGNNIHNTLNIEEEEQEELCLIKVYIQPARVHLKRGKGNKRKNG